MEKLFDGLKYLGGIAVLGAVVLLIGVFMAKAPELHGDWIRHKVGKRTVTIKVGRSGGTGFHVKAPSGQTYILTNAHVCSLRGDDNLVNVEVVGSGLNEYDSEYIRYIPKRVIDVYDEHDLCIVEPIEGINGLSLASSLSVGETIGIVGHPRLFPLVLSKGEYIGEREIRIYYGSHLGKDSNITYLPTNLEKIINDLFKVLLDLRGIRSLPSSQLTAYSRGGSSGSPVVNFYGNIVAVLYAGNRNDPHDSYAVPLRYIEDFLSVY